MKTGQNVHFAVATSADDVEHSFAKYTQLLNTEPTVWPFGSRSVVLAELCVLELECLNL